MALFSLSSLLSSGFWAIIIALIIRSLFFSEVHFSSSSIQAPLDHSTELINSTTKALSSSGFSIGSETPLSLNLDKMHPPLLGVSLFSTIRRKFIDITYTLSENQELQGVFLGDFGYVSIAASSSYDFKTGKEDFSNQWEFFQGASVPEIQGFLEGWAATNPKDSDVSLNIGKEAALVKRQSGKTRELIKEVRIGQNEPVKISVSNAQSKLVQTAELVDSDPKLFWFSQQLAGLGPKQLSFSLSGFGVLPFHSKILWGIGLGQLGEIGPLALSIGASNTRKFSNATGDFFKIGSETYKLGAVSPIFDSFNLMNPWEIKITHGEPGEESTKDEDVWTGELIFIPQKRIQHLKSYWVISCNFQVVYGEFKGVLGNREKKVEIEGLNGVMNFLQANW